MVPLKIAVVDTETADLSGNVYDFAYAICNKRGEIFHTRNFLIREVLTNPSKMMGAFYANKIFSEYIPKIEAGDIPIVSWADARSAFLADCKLFDVNVLAAYNLGFDIRAMKNTHSIFEGGKVLDFSPKLLDIWEFACTTIFQHRNYAKLAHHFGWLSEKGNIRTTAEHAYKYMNDNSFVEAHLAMDDVLIEVEIMADCFRQKKPIPYGVINGKTWRHVNP